MNKSPIIKNVVSPSKNSSSNTEKKLRVITQRKAREKAYVAYNL